MSASRFRRRRPAPSTRSRAVARPAQLPRRAPAAASASGRSSPASCRDPLGIAARCQAAPRSHAAASRRVVDLLRRVGDRAGERHRSAATERRRRARGSCATSSSRERSLSGPQRASDRARRGLRYLAPEPTDEVAAAPPRQPRSGGRGQGRRAGAGRSGARAAWLRGGYHGWARAVPPPGGAESPRAKRPAEGDQGGSLGGPLMSPHSAGVVLTPGVKTPGYTCGSPAFAGFRHWHGACWTPAPPTTRAESPRRRACRRVAGVSTPAMASHWRRNRGRGLTTPPGPRSHSGVRATALAATTGVARATAYFGGRLERRPAGCRTKGRRTRMTLYAAWSTALQPEGRAFDPSAAT